MLSVSNFGLCCVFGHGALFMFLYSLFKKFKIFIFQLKL